MGYLALFSSFILGCWVSDAGWEPRGQLPEAFFVESTRSMAPREALFGGYDQGGATWEIGDRRASVYLWSGDSVVRTYEGLGWVSHISAGPGAIWALAATLKPAGVDSDYRALVSLDGGRTWSERGPIPTASAEQILAVSATEAWVLGMDTLVRTTDAGATWANVGSPGTRDGVSERIALEGGRVVVMGEGVLATATGGQTWMENDVDSSRVYAIAGAVVAARVGTELRVGVMASGGPEWLAAIDVEGEVSRLVVDGASVRMLVVPTGRMVGRGLLYYTSDDNAKAWKAWLLASAANPGAADLLAGGGGVAVDVRRRILAP